MSRFVTGPVLGIETSGALTGVALVTGGRLAGEMSLDARAMSQEVLLDLVSSLLRAHRLAPRDCERIGVALGPGSFTGIRVGMAAARGLAWGGGCALAGVPSHEALAWPWRDLEQPLVLATGLRRGQVYLEAGRWNEDRWEACLAGASVPVESAEEALAGCALAAPALFLGEAAAPLVAAVPSLARWGRIVREPLSVARRPGVVAVLAARSGAPAVPAAEADRLTPLYLRDADARLPAPRPPGGAR